MGSRTIESHCKLQTVLQMHKFHLEWSFENLDLLAFRSKSLESPGYLLKPINKTVFVKIYWANRQVQIYMDNCIELEHGSKKVTILCSDNTNLALDGSEVYGIGINKIYQYFTFSEVLNSDKEIEKIKTLHCDIKYVTELRKEVKSIEDFIGSDELYRKACVLKNYDELYKNEELCDVTIRINDNQMKAHIVILAAASPYFLATFKHKDMKESRESIIDFSNDNDVTYENFKAFLDYVYGCKTVFELKEMAFELLILADKFNMDQLKKSCECCFGNMLNDDNVTKTILLANKYNCQALKNAALAYAKENIDAVKSSDEFEELCKNADVMLELL